MLGDDRVKPRSKAQWILWWRVDQEEIRDQVDKYDTMGWFESARKLSVMCLLLSLAVTIVMTALGVTAPTAYIDGALFAILAAFIFRGRRWAMIAAMALWTFEKLATAIAGLGTIKVTGFSAVFSLLWWAAYMHAFYLAFRVEQARRKPTAPAPETG
jgi:uncharacterized membrane protein